MKSVMSSPLVLAACEPNLAKLPVTQTVRADVSLRSGGLWTTGVFFVVAPCLVIWHQLSGFFAGKLSNEAFWDAVLIWGTFILMFVALVFGTRELYALWQSRSWTRTLTFGEKAIEVADKGLSDAAHWSEDYSAYAGIVLHVTSGELPSHSKQFITLRHNDADRSILLHRSQGNGLDPAIQNRARLWAKQLDVPLFVENETGNLIPLNLLH